MYDKPWQHEDDPEKAILLALQEIAEVSTVEDDLVRNERIIRFRFKSSYNQARYYAQGSVE